MAVAASTRETILNVENLTVSFDGFKAVQDLDFAMSKRAKCAF